MINIKYKHNKYTARYFFTEYGDWLLSVKSGIWYIFIFIHKNVTIANKLKLLSIYVGTQLSKKKIKCKRLTSCTVGGERCETAHNKK